MSTTATTTQTTTQTGSGTTESSQNPPPSNSSLTPSTDVRNALNTFLRRVPGGGGPGGGGPGGGGPPAAPPTAGPNAAYQPVAVAGDVELMGQPPQIFDGDRTKADDFVDQVRAYLRLNRDVAGFNSPMKMAFMLSYIQGKETSAWKRKMGELLDTLDPVADNIPALWDQFLVEFRTRYQDTQREIRGKVRARTQIENHRMRFPDIDQYIASFEELARLAGYTQGDNATTHYFVKGLAPSVMIDVYKPPMPQTYAEIKQRAIDCTRSRMLINDILRRRRVGGRDQPPRFNSFGRAPQQNHPFFSQQQQRGPAPVPQAQQYNSSNAPRWMNNAPAPMDLSRARAPPGRGGQRNSFARVAYQPRSPLTCFQCGKEGHLARNCPQRRFAANALDFESQTNTKN